jgi:hypothetical protein
VHLSQEVGLALVAVLLASDVGRRRSRRAAPRVGAVTG